MSSMLAPRAPFRLDLTAPALRRDPVNVVDRWHPPTYRRVLVLDGTPVEVAVEQTTPATEPRLRMDVYPSQGQERTADAAALLRTMLGLDVDLSAFYTLAEQDDPLSLLVRRFVGLKPPLLPTVFETLLSGIACQQLSLTVGMRLLARLAVTYGLEKAGHHAFPRPEDLSSAAPHDLRALGFSLRKSQTILRLAEEAADGDLDLESLREAETQEAVRSLMDLPGVGRWTAHYVVLRGLGRLEVFPVDDVGAQNRLRSVLGMQARPDAEATRGILRRWGPYQGLLYFHLLLHGLEGRAAVSR